MLIQPLAPPPIYATLTHREQHARVALAKGYVIW